MEALNKFYLDKCDVVDIIGDSQRYLIHISLIHILSCIMDGREEFISERFLKTLLASALAVALYHIFIKKIMEPKLKKLRNICKGISKKSTYGTKSNKSKK